MLRRPRSIKAAEASVAKGAAEVGHGYQQRHRAVIATAVRRDYVDCNT
jgi:hypothetical protein